MLKKNSTTMFVKKKKPNDKQDVIVYGNCRSIKLFVRTGIGYGTTSVMIPTYSYDCNICVSNLSQMFSYFGSFRLYSPTFVFHPLFFACPLSVSSL